MIIRIRILRPLKGGGLLIMIKGLGFKGLKGLGGKGRGQRFGNYAL